MMRRRVSSMDRRVYIYITVSKQRGHKFSSGIAINSSHFLQGDITLTSITVPRRVLSTKPVP